VADAGGGKTDGSTGKKDTGTAPACPANTKQCVSTTLARLCPADGSGWLSEPCGAGETCSGAGVCAGAAGCTPNSQACATPKIAETCAADGSGYVTFPCSANESCSGGVCVAGDSGTQQGCPPNTKQCVTSTVARVCPADGSAWLGVACAANQTCSNGVCVSEDAGTACPPGAQECVNSGLARVCPMDGSGWLAVQCAAGEACTNGTCYFEADAPCTPGVGGCLTTTTGLVCNAAGTAYQPVTCPMNTTCSGGACFGAVQVGSSQCTSLTTLATSNDGFTYVNTTCATGTYCVQTGMTTAACLAGNCTPDLTGAGCNSVCGNKVDSTADQTMYYSVCDQTVTGYQWVAVMCAAPQTCDPTGGVCGYNTPAPACTSVCTPNATRCAPDGSGVQTCTSAGVWGTGVACDPTMGLVCESTTTGAACGNPVCFAAATGAGTCTAAGLFQPCNSSFVLEPASSAVACPAGQTCEPTGQTVPGVYQPGACTQTCVPGTTECSGSGIATCTANGVWGPPTACTGTATCQQYTNASGQSAAVCGACVPGTHQCTALGGGDAAANTAIETCDSTGNWGTPAACVIGSCQSTGTDFACLPNCVPGAMICGGTGGTELGTCSSSGTAGTFAPCPTGQSCRNDSNGNAIGCITCLGPDHGLAPDMECTTDRRGVPGNSAVDTCGPGDTWLPVVKCTPGTTCQTAPVQACETFGQAGFNIPGISPTELITQSNIAAAFPGYGCQNLYYSVAEQCGSTPDCCSDFCGSNFAPVCESSSATGSGSTGTVVTGGTPSGPTSTVTGVTVGTGGATASGG
jgi:hypothetical protein